MLMKKRLIVGVLFCVLFVIALACGYFVVNNSNDKTVLKNERTPSKMHTNALTMMYETEAGSGEYMVSIDNVWPQEGYTFNERLSGCENGSTLTWDDENKKVLMQANKSDRCYVYFDKAITFTEYITTQVYTGTDGENGLYYHDGIGTYTNASEEAGDNSYRYAGANTNNFVCFGSDEAICPEDNLYRIIGVFDGEIKLIKSISIGTMEWGSPLDSWLLSSLYETLNGSYFESISPSWQGLINQNRGWVNSSVHEGRSDTVKQYYSQESTEYQGDYGPKIGLMYVSDYGYAADPSYWTTAMSQYGNTRASNWMYCGEYEWTMVQDSSTAGAFYADRFDPISNGGKFLTYAVRPVFYLKSDVIYVSGTGTQTDPYRIA